MLRKMTALSSVVSKLNQFAPLSAAESWDNVGLLIEPSRGAANVSVERVLLTNDLSSAVVDEALERRVQLIVTYHPILFAATKRLDARRQSVPLRCVESQIAVYSPHTAVDAKANGVND